MAQEKNGFNNEGHADGSSHKPGPSKGEFINIGTYADLSNSPVGVNAKTGTDQVGNRGAKN